MDSEVLNATTFYDPIFLQNGNLSTLSNLNKKKYYQKKNILFHLYSKGQLSNPEICKLTNMSSPSIQKLLKELIGECLVREEGIGISIGGRRPNMYGINPDSRFIIGIRIDQNTSEVAVFNIKNELIDDIRILEKPLRNTPEFIDELFLFTLTVLSAINIEIEKVLSIGIAIPGLTEPITGKSYSYFNYSEKSVKELFEEKFGKPVFIDNDARVMALGEYVFGSACNVDNVLCLNIGAGIGMGMILNGKLYQGRSGFAGEFGHIKMEEDGQLCICGKRGCLETLASGDALVKRALLEIESGKSTKMLALVNGDSNLLTCSSIVEAARMGDQLAIDLFATIGEFLGKGIAILIHLFNPEVIILGGKVSNAGQFIIDPIQHTLNKHTIFKIKNDTTIVTSKLGEKSAVMGAMALAVENIFMDVKNNIPV